MRIAVPSDRPALTAVWHACFGDSSAVVNHFFDAVWDEVTVYVTDDVTAMVTAMPCRWQNRSAAYLYAVATDPAHQGRGLCKALMRFAEEDLLARGYSYSLLRPAEPSLFAFYQKQGYQTVFFSCQTVYRKGQASDLPVSAVSPAAYSALRHSFLSDCVEYPDYLLRLQEASGQLLRIGDSGCAAVEQYETVTFVSELLASDPAAAASSLCHYLNLSSIRVKTPGKEPYAMAKSLDGSPLTFSYLGLAFE